MADPCTRVIRSPQGESRGNISFSAPRDVFLYGRGGRQAVQCSWHLMGTPDQIVRLTITAISTGTSGCQTEVNHQTKALRCVRGGVSHMTLSISEWPWAGVELPLACMCSRDVIPLTEVSHGPDLMLNLTLAGMLPHQDYNHYSFNATYEFLPAPGCPGATRVLSGDAGEVVASSSPDSNRDCEGYPWLLKTPPRHALYLMLPRASRDNGSCASDTRLFFHVPGQAEPVLGVCPAANPDNTIKFFWPPGHRLSLPQPAPTPNTAAAATLDRESEETWAGRELDLRGADDRESSLVVVWEPRSASQLRLRWLLTWFPGTSETMGILPRASDPVGWNWEEDEESRPCRELCPELGACIKPSLWCDGRQHCPQGESQSNPLPYLSLVQAYNNVHIHSLCVLVTMQRCTIFEVEGIIH